MSEIKSPDPTTLQKTIMVCDDQRDVVNACVISLRNKYHVLKAWSGKECISLFNEQRLKSQKIDLLLLDYRLGDMTGEDVAREVTKFDGVKIVLITAYDLEEAVVAELLRANLIVSQLKKPFSLVELNSKINSVLGQN